MNFKKLLLFTLILNLACAFFLNSQEPQPRPKDFMMHNIDFMKKELNLSDDQSKKINDIMFDSFKQIEEKRIDLEMLMLELRKNLLKEGQTDLTKIKSIIDKKTAIMGEIEFITIKRDINIKSILTKEQFLKWKTSNKPEPDPFFHEPPQKPGLNEKAPFNEDPKDKPKKSK